MISDDPDSDWTFLSGKSEDDDPALGPGLGTGDAFDGIHSPKPLNSEASVGSVLERLAGEPNSTRDVLDDVRRDTMDTGGFEDTDDDAYEPQRLPKALQREEAASVATAEFPPGPPDNDDCDDWDSSTPFSPNNSQHSFVRLRPNAPKTPPSGDPWTPRTKSPEDNYGTGAEPYSASSASVGPNAHEMTGGTVTTVSYNPLAALTRGVNGLELTKRLLTLATDPSTTDAEKERQLGRILTWMGPERLFNWEISGHAYQLGLAAVASGALSAVVTWKLRNLMDRCSSFWMG